MTISDLVYDCLQKWIVIPKHLTETPMSRHDKISFIKSQAPHHLGLKGKGLLTSPLQQTGSQGSRVQTLLLSLFFTCLWEDHSAGMSAMQMQHKNYATASEARISRPEKETG